jgi:hypothetical protein
MSLDNLRKFIELSVGHPKNIKKMPNETDAILGNKRRAIGLRSTWWKKLSKEQQVDYLKVHKKSKKHKEAKPTENSKKYKIREKTAELEIREIKERTARLAHNKKQSKPATLLKNTDNGPLSTFEIGKSYKQTYENGEGSKFTPTKRLKNGNWSGIGHDMKANGREFKERQVTVSHPPIPSWKEMPATRLKNSDSGPEAGKYSTRVGSYSLGKGEVGKDIGTPTVVSHPTVKHAMRHLNEQIKNNAGGGVGKGGTYHIIYPSGRAVPLHTAYKETFGEEPTGGDNREYRYPRLKTKKPHQTPIPGGRRR